MDSATTPIPPSDPPTGESAVSSKPGRLLTILWVFVLALVVAPIAWFELLQVLYSFPGAQALPDLGLLAGGTLIAGGTLVAVLVVGLRRRWQTSLVGWGLIGAHLIVSAIIGFFAFRQVRTRGQDSIVLSNVRQLSAAADQYYLEYGVSTVDYRHLVGADKYMKALNPIANETYPTVYVQRMTITISGVAGLRTITYSP